MKSWHKGVGYICLGFMFNLGATAAAYGEGSYTVPKLSKAGTSSGAMVIKSIKEATRVDGLGFQVVIPKEWTLNPTGESDMARASFNAHPTELIEKDPVYFGIHQQKTLIDLKKLKAVLQSKGRKVQEKSGQSFQSLQVEYLDNKVNSREEQIFLWYVKSKAGDFVVLAGAPAVDTKSVTALRTILESLTFK